MRKVEVYTADDIVDTTLKGVATATVSVYIYKARSLVVACVI